MKGIDDQIKIFTCEMNPSMAHKDVYDDGCFIVPSYTSEDYVETIFSICLAYNISRIIVMTAKEFIILSANKDMFAKYGIQIDERKSIVPLGDVRRYQ